MHSEAADQSITVLIATYRRAASLRQTLQGIANQTHRPCQVVVVDNADDPATQMLVESFKPALPIELIVEPTPGQNVARNRAIDALRGGLIVFTDDDVSPTPNWLQSYATAAGQFPEIDVFGGRARPIWPTAQRPWQADAWFAPFAFVDQDLGDEPLQYSLRCLPCSPNMAIRRRVFDQGWRFNPAIGPCGFGRIAGSEMEFFRRLFDAGVVMRYLPDSIVGHRVSAGMLKTSYLIRRCYAMGLGESACRLNPDELQLPRLLGLPRYRLGDLVWQSFALMNWLLLFRRRKAIETQCRIAARAGFAIGVWTGLADKIGAHANYPQTEKTPCDKSSETLSTL